MSLIIFDANKTDICFAPVNISVLVMSYFLLLMLFNVRWMLYQNFTNMSMIYQYHYSSNIISKWLKDTRLARPGAWQGNASNVPIGKQQKRCWVGRGWVAPNSVWLTFPLNSICTNFHNYPRENLMKVFTFHDLTQISKVYLF